MIEVRHWCLQHLCRWAQAFRACAVREILTFLIVLAQDGYDGGPKTLCIGGTGIQGLSDERGGKRVSVGEGPLRATKLEGDRSGHLFFLPLKWAEYFGRSF